MLEVSVKLVRGRQLLSQARMCRLRQGRYTIRFLRLPRVKNLSFLLTSEWFLAIARSWVECLFSVSTPPVHVKPSPVVFHILVLSSGTTYSAEILTGWQMSEACFEDPHPCELTHFNFADDHDLVVILKLLGKVRDGFFQVVLILPPGSSWSRARHVGPEGQPPVRSRTRPWGVIDASSTRYSKLLHDNRTAEISTWFAEQSLLRKDPRTALICIFVEDFGGHISTGLLSLWSLQELRALHGKHDALRGATFLCRISGTDRRKPLGILTNLPGPQEALSLGLPNLKIHGSSVQYHGPYEAVRRLTHPVSEFLPQLVFSRSSALVRSSGNFVFLVYGVR